MERDICAPEFESPDDKLPTAAKWLVQPGQHVGAGDGVLEVETDKAIFAIEAPAAGTVRRLLVEEGDAVRSRQPVAVLAAEQ